MSKALVAPISSKGQLTLPKTVRHTLDLAEGDYVRFEPTPRGVVLTKVSLGSGPFSDDEWQALDRVARQRGRRYRSAKAFLRDLDRA